MSAKMAQSGMASDAPWLAMRAMDGGLDASAQADDRQRVCETHQPSSPPPSGDESA